MLLLSTSSRVDSIAQLLTVTIIFIFVLVLAYITTKFTSELQRGNMAKSNINIVETLKIAPTKYIQIVKIGEKYFSYVVCKDTVTLLGEISKDDILELDKSKTSSLFSASFKDVFEKLKNK